MSKINQKEYLKKYLSIGSDKTQKKKRKKKALITPNRVRIIDDNEVDVNIFNQAVEEDMYGAKEDAPQIVGVIDERPPELRIDDYRKSDKWKPLGEIIEVKDGRSDDEGSKNDQDQSPVRRRRFNDKEGGSDQDLSPVRVKKERLNDSDGDLTPPRRKYDEDLSPKRSESKSRSKTYSKSSSKSNSISSSKSSSKSCSLSTSKPTLHSKSKPKSRWDHNETTLDGKKSGLQSAKEAVRELEELKRKEEESFRKISKDFSGATAQTVFRDRKTGKIRDFEEEADIEREKKEKEEERSEKYTKWGRGLKQVEDFQRKVNEDLREMSKPLARYANDEDLERYLKEQERVGDPMLEYLRKKRRKNDVESNKIVKPQFEGEFMPNRYGIRPGHRWDGVDRSNGYEMKWIGRINSNSAQQEDIYKWSTEDM